MRRQVIKDGFCEAEFDTVIAYHEHTKTVLHKFRRLRKQIEGELDVFEQEVIYKLDAMNPEA